MPTMKLGFLVRQLELNERAGGIYKAMHQRIFIRTDLFFSGLLFAEWIFGIFCALMISPYTWVGERGEVHIHVWAAVFLGLAIVSVPMALGVFRPGHVSTRHAIAVGQMLMSALLIHLTGGRIETHFHVFGSLAFLAFYRDWRVLLTATAIVASDHFLRGVYWPQSVFGTLVSSNWRWLEHAGWVVFEDMFLVYSCLQATSEMRSMASHQDKLLTMNEEIEKTVRARTSELKDTQDRLVQSQKMEALGQLSAGIAHDFNNVLGSILAYASMLRAEHAADPNLAEPLQNIEKASERGAAMVKKLLAFGRKGNYERAPIDLRLAVRDAIELLGPSLEGRIKVETNFAEDIWPIEGDRGQICQSLLNLALNARDAMPKGGSLSFEVRNLVQPSARGADYEKFVEVVVTDSGQGIPQEIQDKIFDPFFTTKQIGKGTGLGLSMVYGTVNSHQGSIVVKSQEGKGTTFTLTFPAMATTFMQTPVAEAPSANVFPIAADLKGMRILVADDDVQLRDCICKLLESRGATVLSASNGLEAVNLYRKEGPSIDAVVLDVTMPEMDGIQAFHELKMINSDVRVLLASGYAESARVSDLRQRHRIGFLEKPFAVEQLVEHILRRVA